MARPYIIVIASEKGGVGKTTLATNLAIYLKGLAEDLPVTLLSFDNHFTIDRMFQLTKPGPEQHVGRLFQGITAESLVCLGQYGVHYIPSDENLPAIQDRLHAVDRFAETLSNSSLAGLVIVDTSPTLDIFTRNALYAADRIIVPIKDAPSLENCRHLADFLTTHQRQKSLLKVLPCLIDTRIHFEGPFRNSYQLLKGYAINRGYRCFEGYIAKSPKVESLGTNPSGKIYPVMTHGRATEVHVQLAHLARQVYLDYLEQGPVRLNEVSNSIFDEQHQAVIDYQNRIKKLLPDCLGCSAPMTEGQAWPGAWYLENNSGACGFIEDNCFMQLLIKECYPEITTQQLPLVKELLVGSDPEACLMIHLTDHADEKKNLQLYRLDAEGAILSRRETIAKEGGFFQRRERKNLSQLFEAPQGNEQVFKEQFILARKTGTDPFAILKDDSYQNFEKIFSRVRANMTPQVP